MKDIIIEKWTNDNGEREDHYFLDDGKKVYLFGVNPKFVPQWVVNDILDEIRYPSESAETAEVSEEEQKIVSMRMMTDVINYPVLVKFIDENEYVRKCIDLGLVKREEIRPEVLEQLFKND